VPKNNNLLVSCYGIAILILCNSDLLTFSDFWDHNTTSRVWLLGLFCVMTFSFSICHLFDPTN